MKRLKLLLAAGILSLGLALPAGSVLAVDVFDQCDDVGDVDSAVCESSQGQEGEADLVDMTQVLVNSLFIALGMVAVVMIVIGGFRYTLSRGEASEVAVAKNIILYSAIGLIVAVMAYTIVNFVLGWF